MHLRRYRVYIDWTSRADHNAKPSVSYLLASANCKADFLLVCSSKHSETPALSTDIHCLSFSRLRYFSSFYLFQRFFSLFRYFISILSCFIDGHISLEICKNFFAWLDPLSFRRLKFHNDSLKLVLQLFSLLFYRTLDVWIKRRNFANPNILSLNPNVSDLIK